MSKLLEVRDLHVHFKQPRSLLDLASGRPQRMVRAVNGVSLDLNQGETLGLVGESGCGKSTLGRAIVGLTPITSGTARTGDGSVPHDQGNGSLRPRHQAQMVFQDPVMSLNPRYTVGRGIAEALQVHQIVPPDRIADRVSELLETVGLSVELGKRRPRALSGGQCQRVGIARALAVKPDFIVADEAVSALDVSIQAQILNLFLHLQRARNLALLFISHDLGVVRHLCQRVAVMYLGRIVETGPTEEVFNDPKHPYTQALIAAIPRMDSAVGSASEMLAGEPPSPFDLPSGCPFHPRCRHAMPVCQVDPPPADFSAGAGTAACHLYAEGAKSALMAAPV